MANTIKIKRGTSSNLSSVTLSEGELAVTTDTNELYVGTASGNTKLNGGGETECTVFNYTDTEEALLEKIKSAFNFAAGTGYCTQIKPVSYYGPVTAGSSNYFKLASSNIEYESDGITTYLTISFDIGGNQTLLTYSYVQRGTESVEFTFSQGTYFSKKVTVDNSLRANTFQNTWFCSGTGSSSGAYCELFNVKFEEHRQGEFCSARIYIGGGNNGSSSQNAFIDLTMQIGWTGSLEGRAGCYWELHPGGTAFSLSNSNIIVIANSSTNYDVYFYTTIGYCVPNYSVNCSELATVTHEGTVSTTAPTGTQCECEGTIVCSSDRIYPVGSIYMSVNNTNPGTLFGGTWVQLENRFLLGAGSSYTAGKTGGYTAIQQHTHSIPSLSGTAASAGTHTHDVKGGSTTGGSNAGLESYASNYKAFRTISGAAYSNGAHTHSVTTNSSTTGSFGSGASSSASDGNMPPYLVVYMWKRTA